MGNTGAALEGIHSLTVNQAGLAALEVPVAGLLYRNHFFDADIHSQAILFAAPTSLGAFGLVANRYALTSAFAETQVGLSYSRRFGERLATGMAVNYHQLRIPNYGGSRAFSIDLGLQYRILPKVLMGVHYANLGQQGYDTDAYSAIPSVLRAGLSYEFADVATVSADVVYLIGERLDPRVGLEYRFIEWLYFRGGISVNPMQQYAGFSVQHNQLLLDFTTVFHVRLGMSPQIGVAYGF